MLGRVLITSRSFGMVDDEPVEYLKNSGVLFDIKQKHGLFDESDFNEIIEKYDGVILGADKFTGNVMDRAARLKIVCKHGVGVDNIDMEYAKGKGFYVTNVPNLNSDAVADIAFALILSVGRRVCMADRQVRAGQWGKIIGTDIYNKSLGIVGFGSIGRRVARRAEGFGMSIYVYDPVISEIPEEFKNVRLVDLDTLLRVSDYVTIHVPLNDNTRNLICAETMSVMKKGAFIINTSRGGIVNEEDLYRFLQNGHIGGAGLDVTEKEPPEGSPLLNLENCIILPHIGMYSKESIKAVDMICAQNVVKALKNERPDNVLIERGQL